MHKLGRNQALRTGLHRPKRCQRSKYIWKSLMDLELGVATKLYEESRIQALKLSSKLIRPDGGCLV